MIITGWMLITGSVVGAATVIGLVVQGFIKSRSGEEGFATVIGLFVWAAALSVLGAVFAAGLRFAAIRRKHHALV